LFTQPAKRIFRSPGCKMTEYSFEISNQKDIFVLSKYQINANTI